VYAPLPGWKETGIGSWMMPYLCGTFPNKDLSICAMVQNEAVIGAQGCLGEGVLICHQGNRHVPSPIGDLW